VVNPEVEGTNYENPRDKTSKRMSVTYYEYLRTLILPTNVIADIMYILCMVMQEVIEQSSSTFSMTNN